MIKIDALTSIKMIIPAILFVALFVTAWPVYGQDDPAGTSDEQEVDLNRPEKQQPAAQPPSPSTSSGQENPAGGTGEEEVDLTQLEKEQPAAKPSGHPGKAESEEKLSPFKFKLFFDLLLQYQFVDPKKFEFTRDHAYVVLEVPIADWLTFRTDISPEPQFFEIIFSAGNTLELRLGKVLIPFGQNEFHHLIGGRVDKQSLFLPTIWADYGFALKHLLYEGETIGFDYSIWVVNGFQQTTDLDGNAKPSSRAGSLTDNNMMKGMGVRPVLHVGPAFSFGVSWYVDGWDDDDEQFMYFYGADVDFGFGLIPVPVLRNLRVRGEIARGEVQLPQQNWKKGIFGYHGFDRFGYNIEVSYRIVAWLDLRYRFGYLDPDNRGEKNVDDLIIHEPGLIARFGPLQWSVLLQLHKILGRTPYPPGQPVDNSCIFTRLLLRY
jgi:hypothetical protein